MAFLRVENKKSGRYLRIISSYRENGKPRHKTLFNLGKAEDYTPEQLQRIGLKLYELGGGSLKKLLGENVQELGRYNYGFYQLYSKVFDYFGISSFLNKSVNKKQKGTDLAGSILLMLLERLHDPSSKLRSYFHQDEYLGIKAVELHHLYRSLDFLADNQQTIQKLIYQTGRNLFNQVLDIVFYDVTTFYFDSEKEGGLRQKGFSKDGKVGKTQVVFGLLIDKEKQPIAYRLYKGDFYEGHSFAEAIATLKETYMIDKIIVVADRGMLSRQNLEYVTKNDGYEFIVGERLKVLPDKIKNHLIDKKNYRNVWIYNKEGQNVTVDYTSIEYNGRKIICTYSEKRAKKDRSERESKLEKSKYLLTHPALIKNKARRYYLENLGNENYRLNEAKIEQDRLYDGFIAIATNNKELSEPEILDHYKHLYQIEHSFRTFKTHLETRPMFHWTDKRIEGHICLCYIAYAMLNHALNKLKSNDCMLSEDGLRAALSKMQVSLLNQDRKKYYLRSKNNNDIEKIIKTFKLKKLPNLTPKSSIYNYL